MNQAATSRVLVLGLEKEKRQELRARLQAAGHDVIEAESLGREEHRRADVIILFAERRDEVANGCGAVKRHPSMKDIPLLAVIPERLAPEVDLSAGMDDIILYPWRPVELQLRVRLALWRRDKTGSAQVLKVGDLTIDMGNYAVRLKGEMLDLTLKEYELLAYLASNPGRVFTRAVLLNSVWGYEYFGGTRTVDVHIRRLRAKLGDFGEEMIQTVRGVGYRFAGGELEE